MLINAIAEMKVVIVVGAYVSCLRCRMKEMTFANVAGKGLVPTSCLKRMIALLYVFFVLVDREFRIREEAAMGVVGGERGWLV